MLLTSLPASAVSDEHREDGQRFTKSNCLLLGSLAFMVHAVNAHVLTGGRHDNNPAWRLLNNCAMVFNA